MTQEGQEGIDFWKGNTQKEAEQQKFDEMSEDEIGTMKIKVPKPVFTTPTKCKIVESKLFKMENLEKNKDDDTQYRPFFLTMTFIDVNNNVEFRETYRGGRIYEKEDGTSTTYIGPTSQLGRLKATCIDHKIEIGTTVKSWAESLKGLICIMQADTVMFGGKKFQKNFVIAFIK